MPFELGNRAEFSGLEPTASDGKRAGKERRFLLPRTRGGPEASPANRGGKGNYPLNSVASRVALWPPKPKELLIATFTFFSRAIFGT